MNQLMPQETLTHADLAKIEAIDDTKDLNELKLLEKRIIQMLSSKGVEIGYDQDVLDYTTKDLSELYYKKQILKARAKMIEKKEELLGIETE